jgi:glycosyltransferase involved in cell wall biosynthesis
MNQVRIHGDPFAYTPAASRLRCFLRLAVESGVRCALTLAGVPSRDPLPGERAISLTDGVRSWDTATGLPEEEVQLVLEAVEECVSASAPVFVFCAGDNRSDKKHLASLEWPEAAVVIAPATDASAPELLDRVRGELRWAGIDNPPHALDDMELRAWRDLPLARTKSAFVHVAEDVFADGTDLVIRAYLKEHRESGLRLRLVLPGVTTATLNALRELAGESAHLIDVISGPFAPEHVLDAAAIVMPVRSVTNTTALVLAMASGRPVCVSRFAGNAEMLSGRGIIHAIGGRNVAEDVEHGAHFAPHPLSVMASMAAASAESSVSPTGSRARRHVGEQLTQSRPASPPPPMPVVSSHPPIVVLEAPIFETSSSSELTIATAQALVRRGNVDLKIVPTTPFHTDLSWLRQRAPELVSRLTRSPAKADLWLSSGWPARAARPLCHKWALRVDWEYGAIPQDMTPHVSEDADLVVVHSEFVYRSIKAAGRPMPSIKVVPHGIDEAMMGMAKPAERVLQFKGDRPAVLFCGGLIWRKGFDVFLSSVLAARSAGHDFVVVVKGLGAGQHYGNFNLAGLLDRFRKTPGTPDVLLIDDELPREELASIYTACDVMVHPYRGEGFCMPVLEARACGLPVLATRGGATDGFMVGPSAHRIASDRRSVELPGAHVSEPWVLEPQADSAGELLCKVLDNLPEQQRQARAFAETIHAAYTWDSAAESLEVLANEGMAMRGVRDEHHDPVIVMPQRPQPVQSRPQPVWS